MDINNMKVTDLKKELKSRGLSIVGNKSELMSRLSDALDEKDSQSLNTNNGAHNEDSVLEDHNEDELLGEDLANESLSKADDHLIEDLLNSETKTKTTITSPKKVLIKPMVTEDQTKAITASIAPASEPNDDSTTDDSSKSTAVILKTTNAIKLSSNEAKELRAKKFGGNKLSEREKRFGTITSATDPKTQTNTNSSTIDDKLKDRAKRFGTIVSDKMKKIEDKEKLEKRKERFQVSSSSSSANPTITSATIPLLKRKIISATNNEDRKQQRLARFGNSS